MKSTNLSSFHVAGEKALDSLGLNCLMKTGIALNARTDSSFEIPRCVFS